MKVQKPNIILITVDSLRSDHLGCYGYHRNTSPYIDSLAAKGVLFSEAITNGGQTPDAFPSILASVLPQVGQGRETAHLETTISEQLKEVGYQTAAFHSNPFISRYYGYARGFDILSDSFDEHSLIRGRTWIRTKAKTLHGLAIKILKKMFKIIGPLLFLLVKRPIVTAEMINRKALSWLRGRREGFFLWLHYMDVHYPYLPAQQYLRQFHEQPFSPRRMDKLFRKFTKYSEQSEQISSTEVATMIDLYDADIKYVDDCISSLLNSIDSDLSNTIVFITADHGEEFGEHGKFGHQSLYDGIVRVPLIITGPGIKGGTIVKQQVSLVDLAPTIAELVGTDNEHHFQGKSLLPVMKGEKKIAEGTISVLCRTDWGRKLIAYRTPNWKYIRTESLDEASNVLLEEIYDLSKDPQESFNMHGSSNAEAEAFELEAVRRIMECRQQQEKTAYEKERIKARLKKITR